MLSKGKLTDLPASPCCSSCVKLYLCSNPEDSVVERRALRETVFSTFREHCRRSLGLDVRVIDPFESRDPSRWPDEQTRQQLIRECREDSAGPFLLALIGHQYGTASLPGQLEVSEYQKLLQQSQQEGINTLELEKSYQRDENAIPASYCLRPPLIQTCWPLESPDNPGTMEVKRDKEREEELKKVFRSALSLCVHNNLMTTERAQRYCRSALDADLRFALDDRPDENIEGRCLVYLHKFINAKAKRQKQLLQTEPETEAADGDLLSELCDMFLPQVVTSRQLLVYTTTTECDPRYGYTTNRRRVYAESLCHQVYSDLLALINRLDIPETRGDALTREQAEQEQLCEDLSRLYEVNRPEEKQVRAFVEQRDQQRPLVVTGGPCTGKTVLLAHCTQQIKSWLSDCDPVVIAYFCNLSIHPSPKHLLSSLCYQISCRYHNSSFEQNPTPCFRTNPKELSLTSALNPPQESSTKLCDCDSDLTNYNKLCLEPGELLSGLLNPEVSLSELRKLFSSLLTLLPSTQRPLVLLLDGLDQLENHFGPQIIESLPSLSPPSVKLVLSASSNRTRLLQAIQLHYPRPGPPDCVAESREEDSGWECVQLGPADRKQCVNMLASMLRNSGRRVTSGQQALVNQALTSCCLPLYARLLHAHTSLWRSDSDVTESSLPDGVHSLISALLDHLQLKHGSPLVTRAVSFLTLSWSGLSEAELADLLSGDSDVLDDCGGPCSQTDVERLLLDLKSFLVKRSVGGSQVLMWVSRHFKLVVAKRFLGSQEVRRKLHSQMADYFSGWWECDKPNQDKNSKTHVYSSSQSLVFTLSDFGRMNLRKVVELPYHLKQSGRREDLERGLLMSLGFHQAMVQAGLMGDLVDMLVSDEGFSREKLLLASILKSSACFLQSSPLQLPTLMESNLLLYLEVFPALERMIRDVRQERRRRRGSGLGIALCPSPFFVPSIQHVKHQDQTEDVWVTEAAGADGGVVAEILSNGSAWIWKGAGCELVKLSLSRDQNELKFAGVKSSRGFLLLSTQCDKLFVFSTTGPEMFLEIKDLLRPAGIEGFVACHKKFSMWWKDESVASVFDVCTESLSHFRCQSSVTCVVTSSDGCFLYCGQEGGTVSIFDLDTNRLLGSFSGSNNNAVTSMILRGDDREIACVDRTGSITLWDVEAKPQQPRLIKEVFHQGKSAQILSADYSDEINTLLVCQDDLVTLWDTCNWELWDQFLAPLERSFTQAVLSQGGNLLLALLESCPFVLVWRVSSGNCVLSLEINQQPRTLFKTPTDFVVVSHDGCLTLWDSEMIDVAGTAPKMKRGVTEVAVEQTGRWFYTADGSERVWRWSLESGLPRAHFLHDGPVEKLRLSPNGVHLVSLSAGEIYVWQADTGENTVRIRRSRATDIRITPNNNFGVSISDRGLSRVWKLAHGGVVCSIHVHLADAQVSLEGTYLIGRRGGDLLAASLWSGSISKRFSCVENSECVIAFHTLSQYPDFVLVLAASGAVYTWKVAEETVYRHFQLPNAFLCQPRDFQMSSDGSYALLSAENNTINLLDLSQVRLCSIKAEGTVIKACLDKNGCFAAFISHLSGLESSCICYLHTRPVLTVTRLVDGETLGTISLPKKPLTLVVCEQRVFVGFEGGSVGVYSVFNGTIDEEEMWKSRETSNGEQQRCPFDREPLSWFPQTTATITWP